SSKHLPSLLPARSFAQYLYPPTIPVIHQEYESARIVGQVADGDVLPIASEVGEGQRALVEHAKEPRRTAAVLDVGLPFPIGSRKVEAVALRDERRQIGRHCILSTALLFHLGIVPARSAPILYRLHRRREGNIADDSPSHSVSPMFRDRRGRSSALQEASIAAR